MITGTHASIGPFCTPRTLASQPCWKTRTVTPSADPIVSRFISAAWTGITNERKMTNSSSAESRITIPKNNGSLLPSTCEKSIEAAVNPPTRTVIPVRPLSAGSTTSRRWLTKFVVATACGAELG